MGVKFLWRYWHGPNIYLHFCFNLGYGLHGERSIKWMAYGLQEKRTSSHHIFHSSTLKVWMCWIETLQSILCCLVCSSIGIMLVSSYEDHTCHGITSCLPKILYIWWVMELNREMLLGCTIVWWCGNVTKITPPCGTFVCLRTCILITKILIYSYHDGNSWRW